jgi:hypothetical protein
VIARCRSQALGALRVTYKRHLEDVRPTEKMR